ncbi:putative receptor-like protein kinase At3g47110 isoform X2 [Ricinus communis]|nr:putative receptor-like protein kinase At3g47110 isoform X2 [Ricinus communis]
MSSWNDSVHFCDWVGVSCTISNDRVAILDLESRRLAGSIPHSIGNLTYLTGLNLKNNSFFGQLPQEMGRLLQLQHMNLTYNFFSGKIPTNLTYCKELRVIEASGNNLVGEVPEQLSSLSKLVVFAFGENNLTGTIPTWIGNFSSLFAISLAVNNFHGNIPNEFGRLKNLGFFQLYGNYLSGLFPSSIYNISSIYFFSVSQNQLHGRIPSDIGITLPKLRIFAIGANNFTGSIPVSFSNASELQVLDFSRNGFTGNFPENLQRLKGLLRLYFDLNNLGSWEVDGLNFLISLSNCTSLEVLGLSNNHFGGQLPSSIGNLSTQLQIFTLGQNLIRGSIPIGIKNLVSLSLLGLEGNFLSGNVPAVLGNLQNLEGLHLNYNRFSGSIPSSLGNLTRLTRLFMEENRFEGSIPSTLGNCQNLQNLNLSSNNLNGSIPKEVIGLSSLSISLVMSHNFLTGSIPSEVDNLDNLMELDLSDNKLSGEIPSSIGSCISLEFLHLEGNEFGGIIPKSLENLRGIMELDLSSNNLSGKIPEFLSELLSLRHLNLSYNNFDGEVSTKGIFANASAISIVGNDKLCGGTVDLLLPTCSNKKQGKTFKIVIPAAIAGVFVIVASCIVAIFCMARNSRKKHSAAPEEWQVGISYTELAKSTDGFSAENLIGLGSFGSVYKGVLSGNGEIVAVKVLNLQQQGASKSFIDECNALRSIRHRNLIRIITTCSSIDHQGNDFKALVFEFMANRSLDDWLHPKADEQDRTMRLSFIKRLNIAIDIASALDYLHHYCETPIVHCDLKPSNVLLDKNMTAHVGDFGLARFLLEASETPFKRTEAMSVSLKGSIGYIPPEYGLGGQVSIFGDVYSYGILLLEMFTGIRPTDDMFTDDISIHKFVAMALPEHVMGVIDSTMLIEEEEEDEDDDNKTCRDDIEEKDNDARISNTIEIEKCLVSIISIGLSCSSRSPGKRMTMDLVVNKLLDNRDSFLRSKNKSRRSV